MVASYYFSSDIRGFNRWIFFDGGENGSHIRSVFDCMRSLCGCAACVDILGEHVLDAGECMDCAFRRLRITMNFKILYNVPNDMEL